MCCNKYQNTFNDSAECDVEYLGVSLIKTGDYAIERANDIN